MRRWLGTVAIVGAAVVGSTAGGADAATGSLVHHVLRPSPIQKGADFGSDLAVSGQFAVIGEEHGGTQDAGEADVYTDSSGRWTFVQHLTSPSPTPSANFGTYVAISGTVIAVSDGGDTDVFELESGAWVETQTLVPSAGATYGQIALYGGGAYGSTLVVGTDTGADVYGWFGTDWTLTKQLTVPDGYAAGTTVAMTENNIIIAAPLQASGKVYFYRRISGIWTQEQKVHGAGARRHDEFGWTLAVSGTLLVIGSNHLSTGASTPGTVYVYSSKNYISRWQLAATFAVPDGLALATDGQMFAVGLNTGLGGVDLFGDAGGSWAQVDELDSPDPRPAHSPEFGAHIAMAPGHLLVSRPEAYVNSVVDTYRGSLIQ